MAMSSLYERKNQLRKSAEGFRSALTPEEHRLRSERIVDRAKPYVKGAWNATPSGGESGSLPPTLLAYMPFGSEPDIIPLLDFSWQQGFRVAVPKVFRENKNMCFYYMEGLEDLESGVWGIREPKCGCLPVGEVSRRDIFIIPGLAFDPGGGRLGYGGGYYDRWISKLRSEGKPLPFLLGLAFEGQMVDRVPMGDRDFTVDAVVTEEREYLCTPQGLR